MSCLVAEQRPWLWKELERAVGVTSRTASPAGLGRPGEEQGRGGRPAQLLAMVVGGIWSAQDSGKYGVRTLKRGLSWKQIWCHLAEG